MLQRPPHSRYGHCWIEYDLTLPVQGTDETRSIRMVYDFSNGKEIDLPAQLYYKVGQIEEDKVRRYTQTEAAVHMLMTEHFGPWVEYADK